MRASCMILAAALPAMAVAQSPTAASPAPIFTTSAVFFALSVSDLDASARWYAEKLGLRMTMSAPRTDATKSKMALLQGGGLTVELVQHDDAAPLGSVLPQARGALFVHGIFKVGFTVDDYDATLAAIRARGVPIVIGPFPK